MTGQEMAEAALSFAALEAVKRITSPQGKAEFLAIHGRVGHGMKDAFSIAQNTAFRIAAFATQGLTEPEVVSLGALEIAKAVRALPGRRETPEQTDLAAMATVLFLRILHELGLRIAPSTGASN